MELSRQRLLTATALIVVVVSAALIYYNQFQPPKISYGFVTVEQAKELVDTKPTLVILDVRTEPEFREGHIEGAVNIPIDELEQRIGEMDKNDEYLVYCRTGNRSTIAAQILFERGYSKVFNMAGGIEAWTRAGFPTVK